MTSGKNQSKLPKWFEKEGGKLYTIGDNVTNPFSGECYTLTAEELSMYDFIMGATFLMEMNTDSDGYLSDDNILLQNRVRRGLDWFRKHNVKAYMILLD